MSCNIYEEPRFSLTERPQADGGEREERQVEIYESADAVDGCQDSTVTRKGEAHVEERLPAVQRNPLKGAVLALGLLCVLLLLALAALSLLHVLLTQQKKLLTQSFQELQSTHNDLTNASCQGNNDHTGWIMFQCSCYYKSGEVKNWTESRRDCQSRGADLVIINSDKEQKFVRELNGDGASWIGLLKKERWENEWKWVDESKPKYEGWKDGVRRSGPSGGDVRAYMNEEGLWEQDNTGSKHWICKKATK